MKSDAVFEGGGMRGIGIIGALSYFESLGYEWMRVAGTSCGALIAALVASGYSAKELKKMMIETDYNKFLDKEKLQKLPVVGKALGFFKDKAMYSGDYIEKWISNLLKAKGVEKFKDLTIDGVCKIKIIASDITQKTILVLPDDLPKYNIDPMEFQVAKAIRMSISIPFYFKPVKLTYDDNVSYIVDGGVTCNFPIEIFDVGGIPRWPTIGFKFFTGNDSNSLKGKHDALSFLFDIAGTIARGISADCLKPHNIQRTVFIPTVGIGITDFNINKDKSLQLYKSGYRSAMDFLDKWDFDQYVKTHRSNNIISA